jgi:hypothetical protein
MPMYSEDKSEKSTGAGTHALDRPCRTLTVLMQRSSRMSWIAASVGALLGSSKAARARSTPFFEAQSPDANSPPP